MWQVQPMSLQVVKAEIPVNPNIWFTRHMSNNSQMHKNDMEKKKQYCYINIW